MSIGLKQQRQHRHMEVAEIPAKPASRRRWPTRLAILLAMLAVLAWLLPAVIAHTPLLGWIINTAAGDLNGSVSVQSASLGWFSPIAVQNVEVRDAEGKAVLTVPSAAGDRSLAAILMNSSNLGRFRLEKPKLSLVLRDDGSNLEDLAAKYLAPQAEPQPKSSSSIAIALEIVDGSLAVTDQSAGKTWQVEKMAVTLDMPGGSGDAMAVKAAAELPDAQRPGKIAAALSKSPEGGNVTADIEQVSLEMFRALLARFMPGTTLAGRLSSTVRGSWSADPKAANRIEADVNAEGFALAAPMLKGDVVKLERLRGSCRAAVQSDRVEIESASLDCDVGDVALSSTLQLDGKDNFSLDALSKQRHELKGRIDLARLAQLLPATLHLREEMQIRTGQLQVAISSKPDPQGGVWHAQLDAANLTAVHQGREIAWQRPLAAVLDAHQTPQGPVIDGLKCESDFLKVHAAGAADNLTASASFNLKQLADELGQFVDFGGMAMAGDGWANLNWKRTPDRQFAADAEIQINKLQFDLPKRQPWREESLLVFCKAAGRTDLGSDTQIESATLNVKSGDDRIDAQLTQPVADLHNGGTWPVHIQMQGQLQNWPARLGVWLPMKDCQMSGAYTLDVKGSGSTDGVNLQLASFSAVPLLVASPWITMNEPRLDAGIVGSWNQPKRRLQLEAASMACGTVAIQAHNVVAAMPAGGPVEIAGTLKYSGYLDRLRQWFADPHPQTPATWALAGQFNGTAQFTQSAGKIHGETAADLTNITVADASGGRFQEPIVHLIAQGGYDNQTSSVQIEKCELTSSVLAANATGHVAPAGGQQNAEISGQIGYDLDRLAGMLRPYIGSGVRVAGRGSSPAWYRGPFDLAKAQANAGFKWDRANVYGLQIGSGEFKAVMGDGAVQVEPMDLAVSQGRMRLAPRVQMSPGPVELTMPAGPLAQQIQIDPALCDSMFKYVAPVLADVTSAQGAFSIELEGCRIPLSAPSKGDLAGRFIIHSVEIGPGPLIRELAVLMGRETPAKLRKESVVPFRMVQGRVYHKDLELMFPDFTIRTYGSVGFDQTMAIMTEMPVPPKWLENNPAADALRNQTIRIPIAGTLSKPELDKNAMEALTKQFLHKAAANLIEGEVGKQLDRLLGPRN